MLFVPVVQHPCVPAGEIAAVAPLQFLIVVGPVLQSANAQIRRPGASTCTVGSTEQPNVSLPSKTIQSTSPIPDDTPLFVEPLESQSSIVPSAVAKISVPLGSSISPVQLSGGTPVSSLLTS